MKARVMALVHCTLPALPFVRGKTVCKCENEFQQTAPKQLFRKLVSKPKS